MGPLDCLVAVVLGVGAWLQYLERGVIVPKSVLPSVDKVVDASSKCVCEIDVAPCPPIHFLEHDGYFREIAVFGVGGVGGGAQDITAS